MNGSEPRDERNMGSIDSWIPFVSLRHPRSLSLISLPVGDGSEDERSEPSASRSLRSRYAEGMEGNDWSEPRDEDKNAIHLSRLSILSLPFGAEGGPEAEPNGERMG